MYRETQEVMGTVVSYAVAGDDAVAAEAVRRAREWLIFVDETFSTYKPSSDVSRIRDGVLPLADAHPLVAEVVTIGETAVADSGGAFTLEPGGRFDPSGVVKGWSIERASALLMDAHLPDHMINGGGDIQARGEREPGQYWRVAIADPRDRSRSVAIVSGPDPLAVATSGTAERGEHVQRLDGGGILSVTVVGERLTDVDIAATTAFALGDGARDWIEERPHLAAFAILEGGRMWTSTRMQQFLVG